LTCYLFFSNIISVNIYYIFMNDCVDAKIPNNSDNSGLTEDRKKELDKTTPPQNKAAGSEIPGTVPDSALNMSVADHVRQAQSDRSQAIRDRLARIAAAAAQPPPRPDTQPRPAAPVVLPPKPVGNS
jgi:hypothetical protein